MMGMGDGHRFQRRLGYRCSVLWVFRPCQIEPCKPCICTLWTPLPKHWPTQTRMGFGRNGVVRTQWSNARRCARIARDRNGYWKGTSNPAVTQSATHGCCALSRWTKPSSTHGCKQDTWTNPSSIRQTMERHKVVQSALSLLIWRWTDWNGYFARNTRTPAQRP